MRRAQPYGPVYNPAKPDNEKRGLIGNFIVGDIESQFEFVMSQWINGSDFTACLGPVPTPDCPNPPNTARDPILSYAESIFVIPMSDENCSSPNAKNISLQVPQLVFTRGGAYCFLPSLSAVRWIVNLKESLI